MQDRFEMFTVQIAKISRYIRKIKSEEMAEYNLKSPHVSCLYYLYKSKKALTAKNLCDVCDEDKAAISRSLDYLEENGFIKCNCLAEKRYKSPLSLTLKGNEIGEKIAFKIDEIVNFASCGINEEDRQTLYKCLYLISNNLQKISEKGENKNGN